MNVNVNDVNGAESKRISSFQQWYKIDLFLVGGALIDLIQVWPDFDFQLHGLRWKSLIKSKYQFLTFQKVSTDF